MDSSSGSASVAVRIGALCGISYLIWKIWKSDQKESLGCSSNFHQIRAGFDVGSGATKMQVAAFDPTTKKLAKVFFSEQVEAMYSHDLASNANGELSSAMLKKGLQVLREFNNVAAKHGCDKDNMRGIATAVFRKAKNGQEYLRLVRRELGIRLNCIDQDLEGKIGYMTGRAFASSNNVLVWDSGGGSFQITGEGKEAGVVEMFGEAIGSSVVTDLAVRLQGKTFDKCKTPNPMTPKDADRLQEEIHIMLEAKTIPLWLRQKLDAGAEVVAIGGPTCAFRMCAQATGKNPFRVSDISMAIQELVGSTDDDFEAKEFLQPSMVITKLVLVMTVMKKLGIKSVKYSPTNGSTTGVLLTPQIWETQW